MFLTVLTMKIWLSSPCDGLLLILTIQQAGGELTDSLVLISSMRTAPKAIAFVANLAHDLKQFPGVRGLVFPKSASPVIVSCWWTLLIPWVAFSPWKVTRLCPLLSFSEFHSFFQTMSKSKQHQVLFQVSGSATFIQDIITVPCFTTAVSVLFGSSPGAGNVSNWDS